MVLNDLALAVTEFVRRHRIPTFRKKRSYTESKSIRGLSSMKLIHPDEISFEKENYNKHSCRYTTRPKAKKKDEIRIHKVLLHYGDPLISEHPVSNY
jgi:hypothetical protein